MIRDGHYEQKILDIPEFMVSIIILHGFENNKIVIRKW